MNTDTLLMFSGGIDSTYVAYDYLINNPNKTLLMHHIHLINRENRAECERNSVKKILTYFQNHNITNYTYTESTFDYGSLPFIIYDIEIVAFIMYVILRNPANSRIDRILLPYYMNQSPFRYKQHNGILATLNKSLNFIYPIKDMQKKDVMDKLPKDLLDLTWFCRRPINNQPCNECITCKEISDISRFEAENGA